MAHNSIQKIILILGQLYLHTNIQHQQLWPPASSLPELSTHTHSCEQRKLFQVFKRLVPYVSLPKSGPKHFRAIQSICVSSRNFCSHHGLANPHQPLKIISQIWIPRAIYIFGCFCAEMIRGTTSRWLPESFFPGWPWDSKGPRSAGRDVPPAQPGVRCRKNDAKSKTEKRFRKVFWKSLLLSTESFSNTVIIFFCRH